MVGPPGACITLLGRAIPGILPRLTIEEALDVTRIYSVAEQLPSDVPLILNRPFCSPHHTISHAGLVGGGNWPHPGEISLAHRGVLLLDELPEFRPSVLEVMRQPIEDKIITISRAQGSIAFPANFQLISAMNSCVFIFVCDILSIFIPNTFIQPDDSTLFHITPPTRKNYIIDYVTATTCEGDDVVSNQIRFITYLGMTISSWRT